MHHAAKAYGTVARETASPRDLEANLLLRAASKLQLIHDNWERDRDTLDGALLYNRKLWSVFLTSVTSPGHPLPSEIRQNVANLGIFVFKQTLSVMSEPRPEQLRPLISINRELAQGLLGRA